MMASKRMVLGITALAFIAGCQTSAPEDPVEHGEEIFTNYCQPCHGADGAGTASIGAPSIAGLSKWYVQAQLGKFRSGQRGLHFDDIEGMRMRPMSLALHETGEVELVANYVTTLKPTGNPITLHGGNAEKGATHFKTCEACHGADGKGNQLLNAPSLVQADDWYLYRQIDKFRKGIRGANPADTTGAQMAPMAATLPDEQAMQDVVAYIKTLSH